MGAYIVKLMDIWHHSTGQQFIFIAHSECVWLIYYTKVRKIPDILELLSVVDPECGVAKYRLDNLSQL